MTKIKVISSVSEKQRTTKLILSQLLEWFELEDGITEYIEGVRDKKFLIAEVDGEPVGFVVVKDHNEWTSEIYLLAVLRSYHRCGIGRELVNFVCEEARETGKEFLAVKTLDESSGDKFYEKTRQFYRAMGFVPLVVETGIWDEKNPCLIMVKNVT